MTAIHVLLLRVRIAVCDAMITIGGAVPAPLRRAIVFFDERPRLALMITLLGGMLTVMSVVIS